MSSTTIAVVDFARLSLSRGTTTAVLSGWWVGRSQFPPSLSLRKGNETPQLVTSVHFYARPDVVPEDGLTAFGFEYPDAPVDLLGEVLTGHVQISFSDRLGLVADAGLSELAERQIRELTEILALADDQFAPGEIPAIDLIPDFRNPVMSERLEQALDQVSDAELLSSADKRIFHEALRSYDQKSIARMSIFIDWSEHVRGKLYRAERLEGRQLFYFSRLLLPAEVGGVFVDATRRIAITSRYFMHDPITLAHNVEDLVAAVQSVDISRSEELPGKVLATEKWHHSYGHLHDELFALNSARDRLDPRREMIPLTDFLAYDSHGTVQSGSRNLRQMAAVLSPAGTINSQDLGAVALRLRSALIVGHRISCPSFHEFEPRVAQGALESIEVSGGRAAAEPGGALFLTRGAATALPRNLSNQAEIERLLQDASFRVVNPELIDFFELMTVVSQSPSIVITWGSALTNLAYAPTGARVCILQSDSYQEESFEILFSRIVHSRDLQVTVLASEDNIVSLDRVASWIAGA